MNTDPSLPSSAGADPCPPVKARVWIIWLAVFAGIVLLLIFKDRIHGPAEMISQHRFQELVQENAIQSATINYGPQNAALNEVVGKYYKTNEPGIIREVPFRADVRLTPSLERELLSRPEFEPHEPNTFLVSIVVSILPFVIIAVIIWYFFIRQIRKVGSSTHVRTLQQQDRFDLILIKWEEQTRRMDAVLDRLDTGVRS